MVKKKNKHKKMPFAVRSILSELTADLLKKCSTNIPVNGIQSWQNFVEISEIIERIKELELDFGQRKESNRVDEWTNFTNWAQDYGIEFSGIALHTDSSTESGFGLQTTSAVNENDLIIRVPKSAMFSAENALKTKIGPLIKKDPILQRMPNIALSLYLLYEISEQNSMWKTYFNILPQKYSTVLYFSNEELQLLKGSPLFDQSLKFYQNIARQYAYFYRIFNNDPEFKTLPLKEYFTFENYRWAVSTVMTRQNTVPSKNGKSMVNVLIPMWDMCNHLQGKMSTDFNESKEFCECYAMQDFTRGAQVCIYYGERSNSEFFLHNGFVYPENENDNLSIRLGISKSDALFEKKMELLNKIKVKLSGSYELVDRSRTMDDDTLAFIRVFLMSKDQVEYHLSQDKEKLLESDDKVLEEVMQFLRTRAMLLLKNYPTTVEEDLEVLSKKDQHTSGHAYLVSQLLVCEKRILLSYLEPYSN